MAKFRIENLVYAEDKETKSAREKFQERGAFGVTDEDYHLIGSTPSPDIESNPGKTRAEFMTDKKIYERLQRDLNYIRISRKIVEKAWKNRNSKNSEISDRAKMIVRTGPDTLRKLEETFYIDLKYLKSVGRLPKEFEQALDGMNEGKKSAETETEKD